MISMTRPTKSFQSDSINGGQNCLLQRLSKSKVRKKVRCALLSHSTNMSAASCTFQGPKVSCNLRHHDVGLNVSPSKSLFNPPIMLAPHLPELSQLFKCVASQAPVQPAVASHLMGARVFITFSCTLLAMTKASITTYSFPVVDIQLQRLRTFSSSSPYCMVTMQVPSPCSVGCETCGVLQIPCPYQLKPHEVVFRQKSTFLVPAPPITCLAYLTLIHLFSLASSTLLSAYRLVSFLLSMRALYDHFLCLVVRSAASQQCSPGSPAGHGPAIASIDHSPSSARP